MKYPFVFLVLMFTLACYGQCDTTLMISENDKESFVKTYLDIKNEKPQNWDERLFSLAEKYRISPTQFREIQHSNEIQRPLTASEQSFSADIHKMKVEYANEMSALIGQVCERHDISRSQYEIMLLQYRSCIKFQRSLAEYFKKWMK